MNLLSRAREQAVFTDFRHRLLTEGHVNQRVSIGLAALLCSSLLSAADLRPLAVKTGQWETTMSGQTTGQPPLPDELLKRLSPEQRAQVEKAMQEKALGGRKTTLNKSCLTKEKLDKGFNLGDENTKACKPTLVASSGSSQEIHLDCARQGMKSTGTVKVEAMNPENVKGTLQMSVSNAGRTMNINYTFTAKWIGPACSGK
jgi:hypothetical protein